MPDEIRTFGGAVVSIVDDQGRLVPVGTATDVSWTEEPAPVVELDLRDRDALHARALELGLAEADWQEIIEHVDGAGALDVYALGVEIWERVLDRAGELYLDRRAELARQLRVEMDRYIELQVRPFVEAASRAFADVWRRLGEVIASSSSAISELTERMAEAERPRVPHYRQIEQRKRPRMERHR